MRASIDGRWVALPTTVVGSLALSTAIQLAPLVNNLVNLVGLTGMTSESDDKEKQCGRKLKKDRITLVGVQEQFEGVAREQDKYRKGKRLKSIDFNDKSKLDERTKFNLIKAHEDAE
ncbi:MAG: hypothetical protein U1F68_02500 [Gammaproteobacteria bacterium]